MKKTILIVALLVLVLGALSVGVVYAQGQQPPVGGRGMTLAPGASAGVGGGGVGWMHDYVEEALAAKLGLTEAQVEEKLASGQTMYQIALDAGIAEADIPALLTEVHTVAFDKAVTDGVVTREQADFMLQRMQTNGFGNGTGTCPMGNGTYGPNGTGNGNGFRGGPGNMMGGRWQNQQTNP